mmetsp:Transcript_164129/g.526325  ORF Transcript_164129/g.526325 Transcript_164129/m.526325 type:complete len:102 (+) Transcript_164129:169-474(+)
MPEWMNMVQGVVDPEDLPWDSSRVTLQLNTTLRVGPLSLVKKGLQTFALVAEKGDDYKQFSVQSGMYLKFSVHEDSTNRTMFAALLDTSSARKRAGTTPFT